MHHFGHTGENSINKFMQGIKDKEQINSIIKKRMKCFGEEYEKAQGHIGEDVTLSFEHNEQSALVFYELLNNGDINLDRVDVNKMIYAILAHSTTRVAECPKDLVAQVVRHTDKIEYRNKDFDEVASYIKPEKIRNRAYAEKTSKERIDEIKKNIVKEAIQKGKIDDNMESLKELKQLRKDYEAAIYFLKEGRKGLLTSENIERNKIIITKLLEYYYANPDKISAKSYHPITPINCEVKEDLYSIYDSKKNSHCTRIEKAINFILSMDNISAEKKYLRLVKQRIVLGKGMGIEPITEEERQAIRDEQEEERIEKWRAEEFRKSNQPHTKQEIKNMLRARDCQFMEELTPKGIEVMKKTEKKIEEDTRMDNWLCEQMEEADLARKYNRKEKITKIINRMIGEKSDNEKRSGAVIYYPEMLRKQLELQGEAEDYGER